MKGFGGKQVQLLDPCASAIDADKGWWLADTPPCPTTQIAMKEVLPWLVLGLLLKSAA
jgi:hypothetical protein